MNKVSLLVVEDHELYSQVLLNLLNQDEKLIVDVVQTAEEALEKLTNSEVDLVLVDIGLPRIDGITLVKQIQDRFANIPCLMISGHLSHNHVRRALKAGARGYLLKDNYTDILEGIWSVINGNPYFSEGLGQIDSDEGRAMQIPPY